MTATQRRCKHLEAFGEPTRSGHKDHLVKRIAWRLQAQAEGGLSERARRRAEQLANDADLRTTAPKHPTDDTASPSAGQDAQAHRRCGDSLSHQSLNTPSCIHRSPSASESSAHHASWLGQSRSSRHARKLDDPLRQGLLIIPHARQVPLRCPWLFQDFARPPLGDIEGITEHLDRFTLPVRAQKCALQRKDAVPRRLPAASLYRD